MMKRIKKSLTPEDIWVIVHKVDVLQIPFCIVVKLLMRQLKNIHRGYHEDALMSHFMIS